MGMFDTVHMKCPNCGERTSEQTKNGECCLDNHELNENDKTTLGMVGVHYCEHCHKPFRVELASKPFAVIRKLTDVELSYTEEYPG